LVFTGLGDWTGLGIGALSIPNLQPASSDAARQQRNERTPPGSTIMALTRRNWLPRGCRLHLLCTLHGLPVGFALTGAKADERHTLPSILTGDPDLAGRVGQTLIADKNYYGREFEATLPKLGIALLRPARKGEPDRPSTRFFKPLRQIIESINDTLKGQLDLERHGGRTIAGVLVRVWQRLLALTAVIWHNDHTGQHIKRSLIAYDH
jgi:Transposase DDE domain